MVDTQKMTLEVSEHRRVELLSIMKKWTNMKKFNLKQLQSLIGKLSFITNCVRAGRVYLNRLLQVLRSMDPDPRKQINMKPEIVNDLQWWINFLPKFNGLSILWLQDRLAID